MTKDLEKAEYYVEQCDYTCALVKGEEIFTSADRVAGRGAAFLYILLGVGEVYTRVISEGALELLKNHGIAVYFRQSVKTVMNRNADGPCPIEAALEGISDPEEALEVIKNTLQKLKGE